MCWSSNAPAETIVDKAVELEAGNLKYTGCICVFPKIVQLQCTYIQTVGGAYGGLLKPTPFLCLVLKMLQIQPEKDIVIEYIKNWDYKYVIMCVTMVLKISFLLIVNFFD